MKEENWKRQLVKDLDFYIDGYYSKNGMSSNPCGEIVLPKEKNRRRLLIRRVA